jgi:putative ABC transport system permease protein
MLSLARGFKATLVSSGSEDNAIIMRAGATSEMTGGVTIDTVKIVQDAPGIARSSDGPLVTPEVVLVAPIPLKSTGTDANVQVRGVSKNVLQIRNKVKIVEGRMFTPGLTEIVVGKNANTSYSGLTLGNTISLGNLRFLIVEFSTRAAVRLTPKSGATRTSSARPTTARTLSFNPLPFTWLRPIPCNNSRIRSPRIRASTWTSLGK